MCKPLTELDINTLKPGKFALFLDLDGTLAPIAQKPDAVFVANGTREILMTISRSLNGALAIVSGREILEVDRLLADAVKPVAGIHGIERRDANGVLHRKPVDQARIGKMERSLQNAIAEHPGLMVETKNGTVALHYRERPDLEENCAALAGYAVRKNPDFVVMPGKMVFEIKPASVSKGDAVLAFMREVPFTERIPFYAGDDVTDEAGFSATNQLGGISVKIGGEPTCAKYRVSGTDEFLKWMERLSRRLQDGT